MTQRAKMGFTLLEVLVAITIGAIVVLGARALIEGAADGATRVNAAARAADASANGERLLRQLVGDMEVGTDSMAGGAPVRTSFSGDARAVRFATWCAMPGGYRARCRALIEVDAVAGRPALVAVLSTGETVVLRRDFHEAELRYLADPAAGGRWYGNWGDGLTAPLALGVLVAGDSAVDTLVVRIGERG